VADREEDEAVLADHRLDPADRYRRRVPAGDVIENPAALMRLRLFRTAAETDGDLLEMEATYEPGSVEPLEHFHPNQDEHFEILAGTMGRRP
jgi:hypothetical protein